MPGSRREQSFAQEEGIDFNRQVAPEKFELPGLEAPAVNVINADQFAVQNTDALIVTAMRTQMSLVEGSDRMTPPTIPGSAFEIEADVVINALGFSVVNPGAYPQRSFALSRRAAITVNPNTLETAIPGVYAAGDAATVLIWWSAINQGRKVAEAIHENLSARTGIEAA